VLNLFIHYRDKAIFYYCDNNKFADTNVTVKRSSEMRKDVKYLIEITFNVI